MAHLRGSGDCDTVSKKSDATALHNKEPRLRIPSRNFLSIGDEFFRSIKEVKRPPTCANCGLTGKNRCSRCHQTYYCSVECQKQNWKAHSVVCGSSSPKEPTDHKPLSGADGVSGDTKAKTSHVPEPKNKVLHGRKVMLCDLEEKVLSEGTQFQGYVMEYTSPSDFFVNNFDGQSVDNVMKVTSSLQKFYSDPSNIRKGYTPDTGEVCVAKYEPDPMSASLQQWYRVLVYNVERSVRTAQVLYLDFGNKETVALDNVQPLHGDVELLPPSALHCSLAHVTAPPFGWSTECLSEVKRLLIGHKLLIRIIDVVQGDIPHYSVDVSLIDSGEHINKIIIEKGYSFPPLKDDGKDEDPETVPTLVTQTEMPALMPEDVCQDDAAPKPEDLSSSLSVGDHFETLITVIHNPEIFFCQQVQNAKQLSDLMLLMHEHYSTSAAAPGFLPAPGAKCAAQFTEDNNWYRSSVLRRLAEDSVLVKYLDFGNTETLPISRVRGIEPSLLSLPFQALECCLAGVKPQSGSWTSEATDAFKTLVMNKQLTACVVAICDRVLTLELIDKSVTPNISISKHLLEAGLAAPSTPSCESPAAEEASQLEDYLVQWRRTALPMGQETEVVVCMLQHPGEFFCHINNQTALQLLNKLNITIGHYCMQHKSEGYYPAREEICGAYYAGDGNWYRAQVKDVGPGGSVKVQFLDYGNEEEVSVDKLSKIPSSFLELPFQAICCRLSGVKPAGENWGEESAKAFQKSVVGVKLLAKALDRTKDGYSVELVAKESRAVIANELIAVKAAVRDDKSVKEKIDVNNNKALRSPRDPSLTSKILPVWNANEGALTRMESLSPVDCSSFPSGQLRPLRSIPLILRDALSALPKTSKEPPSPNLRRDFISDQPDGRDRSISAPKDVHYPKSIPFAAMDPTSSSHGTTHSNKASTSSPKESQNRKSTSPIQGQALIRNPIPSAHRGGLNELSSSSASASVGREIHPSNSSPSSKNEMHQTRSIPAASREFGFPNSTSLMPSKPHASLSATPKESPSCVSPPPGPHHMLQAAFPVEHCTPSSLNFTPSSSNIQSSNSSLTTLIQPTSPGEKLANSVPSNESLHGEVEKPDGKSVNGLSAASRDLPGVSIAQTWTSVDLPLNEAVPACVLKVISPDLFYVFPKENRVDVKKLHQVMMEIVDYCSKETENHNYSPLVGDACCAKFTEDGQWYRAVVLEVHDSSARIIYADYGNMEVLPFSSLLPMKQSFLEFPVQLTKCSLADVLPITKSWPPEATQALCSVLLGAEVLITAQSLDAGVYRVSVDKQQEGGVLYVGERLVMDGLARSVMPMTNSCSEGNDCCCRDLLKRVEKLENMMLYLLNTQKLKQ
ncbi:tudor domain-containing protein 1 [Bufo bufo]|uniref:tudor domain-containing protein 1 n=1 Tax=Bufo bufo TaxID=8384 RepID=UPI001ABDD9CE|nr:tudor domain-containing protein 1 [Bufo bufo]